MGLLEFAMMSITKTSKSCFAMALTTAVLFLLMLNWHLFTEESIAHSRTVPRIKTLNFTLTVSGVGTLDSTFTVGELKSGISECVYPQVDPFDPSIMELAGLNMMPLDCASDFMPEITYIDGLYIRVNSFIFDKNTTCKYRNITRVPFQDSEISFSNWSEAFSESMPITEEHEFIHVKCLDSNMKNKVISKAFYSLVPKRPHLNSLYKAAINKRLKQFKPKETLNVIVFGLDGLPRHQMIRAMPKTYKLLTDLKSFDFTMHGQTGDNTLSNFLSFLTPYNFTELSKWWGPGKPEDTFDLIWKDYEQAGYRTLFTEDDPKSSGFYYRAGKFIFPQTSYWNRPLQLAMHQEPGFIQRKGICNGPRSTSENLLNYLMRFLDTFPSDPVTCWTMISDVTHDYITNAASIDGEIYNFYKFLLQNGHLNRSVVIFFSDHGSRWGKIRETYNGLVESRNPLLVVTFPTWFLEKYPDIARNLHTNTRRLTSHFDTRQMLLDLLYFKAQGPTPPFRGEHGMSLFQEIPANRTCAEASIPEEYCLCGQRVHRYLKLTSPRVATVSQALLSVVRNRSDSGKCEQYRLGEVLQVAALAPPKVMKNASHRHLVCRVRISVQPGGAIFEGTVAMDQKTKKTKVGENIERLNMYKGEKECLPTPEQQIFCYCKSNRAKT